MEPDYKEIGRNIRAYRIQRGLKQRQLAELIGLTEQHISHIENAHTKLSLATLISISHALQVDCNTLLGTALSCPKSDIYHQKLSSILSTMDEEQLATACRVCQALVESK